MADSNTKNIAKELLNEVKNMVELNNSVSSYASQIEENIKYITELREKQKELVEGSDEYLSNKEEEKKIEEELISLKNAQIQYLKTRKNIQKEINKELEKEEEEERKIKKIQEEGFTFLDKWEEKKKKYDKENNHALNKIQKGWGEVRKGVNDIKSGFSSLSNTINKQTEYWKKSDNAAMGYARSIGMSQKAADSFRTSTLKFIDNTKFALNFGKSAEELINLQQKYSSVIGRSIMLSNEQKTAIGALSKVVGDDLAVDLSSKLENFGLSTIDVGERITEIFNNSSEKGIVFEKYTKTFADNIKIAQNYTFKEGLKGLAAMAEKSVAIKLNLSQATALADKVNTVEGAIKTSSQLQVLGGPFAAYANPMAMLYEGLNDVGKLQERIVNMYGNLGSFNYETGEMKVSAFNKMRIKKASEAMGLDYSNVMEMINTKGKRNAIGDKYFDSTNLTDIQKEFLYNKATYQNGEWGVTGIDGKFNSMSDIVKGGKDSSLLKTLINENKSDSENIADIATALRSLIDIENGAKTQIENHKALTIDKTMESVRKMADEVTQHTNLLEWIARLQLMAATAQMASSIIGMGGGMLRMGGGAQRMMQGARGIRGGRGGVGPSLKPYGAGRIGNTRRMVNAYGSVKGARVAKNILGPKGAAGIAKIGNGLSGIGGVGAIMGGVALDAWQNNRIRNNNFTGTTALGTASGALSGAATGAMIGSMIPFIGTAIGAIGGAIIGGIFGGSGTKKQIEEQLGVSLKGNYSEREYQEIASKTNVSSLSPSLLNKLSNNNDLDTIKNYFNGNRNYANGGVLLGPSHANGGMPILGSNQVVEGGEFVINKESTKKYFKELQAINNDSTPITPTKPMGDTLKVSEKLETTSKSNNENRDIKINPIDIKLSGTIKLDTGKQNIDISKEILNNSVLIKEITNMITKQLNINVNSAFNKETFRQKYI